MSLPTEFFSLNCFSFPSSCQLVLFSIFSLNSFFLSLIFSIVSFSNLCFLELNQFMPVLLRFIRVFVSSLNSLNFLNMFIAALLDCLGSHLGDSYWRMLLQGGRCLWQEILSIFILHCLYFSSKSLVSGSGLFAVCVFVVGFWSTCM